MAADPLKSTVTSIWGNTVERLNKGQEGIQGLLVFSDSWATVMAFLNPYDIRQPKVERYTSIAAVKRAFASLNAHRYLPRVLEAYIQNIRKLESLITAEILASMKEYEATEDVVVVKAMISKVVMWWKGWAPIQEAPHESQSLFSEPYGTSGDRIGSVLMTSFNLEFQTHFYSVLPPSFPSAFKQLCQSTIGAPPDSQLWRDFEILGLLDRYENLIASVCYEQIEERVHETCEGVWSERVLEPVRKWMVEEIVPWMILPYARGAKNEDETRAMLQGMGSRFDYHVCKTLCDLRTFEIFDIIVDYPDSQSALLDLQECLQRVDQRNQLVQTLRRLNRKRLLHPGADTKDILAQYVSMIRCLRIIDPPGVLLYKVADPVRRYLRDRPDTIRSIVASLVGEGGDLIDENEPIQPLQAQYEDYSDPSWEPEAVDAGPEFRTNKPSDVISTLVSIYDSKDLFVKELQVLLAQRLLAIRDGNFEKERTNIEILKLRFGDAALQVCEVMLKDMTDSRRIDQHVQSQSTSVLHPTVISKQFWPALQSSKLEMPGQFKSILQDYSKEFTLFKPDKRLRWLPHLGTVELSIELRDRTVEVEVPPLEAAIIELFAEKEEGWTLKDISAAVGNVDVSAVQNALVTWINHGVLRESNGIYTTLENEDQTGTQRIPVARAEEEVQPVASVEKQEAEQMRIYWKFIEGMLTNLGSLPLDRIQTMLKLAPGYSRTQEQLAAFLEAAKREGLVTVSGGIWKLNK